MRVVRYWLPGWQAAMSDADADAHRQRHEHGAAARLALAVSHVEAKLAVVSSRHGPLPAAPCHARLAERHIIFGGPSPSYLLGLGSKAARLHGTRQASIAGSAYASRADRAP